jgi:hypothetical protein
MENAHVLTAMRNLNSNGRYGLIFMKNSDGKVNSFQPFTATSFQEENESTLRRLSQEISSARENLNDGDRSSLLGLD